MPAARRWLDPSTRDYVISHGGPRDDVTRASQVLLRLATHRGSCAVAPELGSRLHLITRESPGATQRAVAYALEALADLIRRGVIRDVAAEASVEGESTRYLEVRVSFRDDAPDPRSVRFERRIGGAG